MKLFQSLLVVSILFATPAYSSPPLPDTPKDSPAWEGERKALEKSTEEVNKEILNDCLARHGGDTPASQHNCREEMRNWQKFTEECLKNQTKESNVSDAAFCKEQALIKARNIK